MPIVLRRLLGFIVLVATIGLATCQSLVKAEPLTSSAPAEASLTSRTQAR
ncbi:hypothetical protein [Methylobacter sp. YRD-M1]|jgi:hypothetical protein|nr:hypothetical protein [Methylobacter sp. YRD-M1]WAK01575.1 hypothetical protein LZ558_17355 [Methylobacter sp. YRD-M1]